MKKIVKTHKFICFKYIYYEKNIMVKIIRLTETDLTRIIKKVIKESNGLDLSAVSGKIKLGDGSMWVLETSTLIGWQKITVVNISDRDITVVHPISGSTITKPVDKSVLENIVDSAKYGKKVINFKDNEGKEFRVRKL